MHSLYQGAVKPEWVDYNGHMGDFAYSIVFTDAVAAFAALIGSPPLRMSEIRIAFLREVHEADTFHVGATLISHDHDSIRMLIDMVDEKTGLSAARADTRLVAGTFDAERRLVAHEFAPAVMAALAGILATQGAAEEGWPHTKIGIRRAKA